MRNKFFRIISLVLIMIFLSCVMSWGEDGLFIRDGGKVGIGTTSPNKILHVYSAEAAEIRLENGSSTSVACFRTVDSDGNAQFHILAGGSSWTPASLPDYVGGDTWLWNSKGRLVLSADTTYPQDAHIMIKTNGNVGIGNANPDTKLHIDGVQTIEEVSSSPSNPDSGTQGRIYIKNNKLIIQFNDGGTVRYKYLDLTGTGISWDHTTDAP